MRSEAFESVDETAGGAEWVGVEEEGAEVGGEALRNDWRRRSGRRLALAATQPSRTAERGRLPLAPHNRREERASAFGKPATLGLLETGSGRRLQLKRSTITS